MINFAKTSFYYLIIAIVIFGLFLIPKVRVQLKEILFPMATIKNAITISNDDYDIELKGINAPNTNLKNFKNKNLFLNFWGTWCPPCRAEWPSIEALHTSKKNELDFVLIAMQDEEENVKKFLKDNNYTTPVYIAQSPIPESLLPKAFPTTYLINKNGKILYKEDSSRDWNSNNAHQLIEQMSK
jgi:thiol-disulfide isomerase/thioredoxin